MIVWREVILEQRGSGELREMAVCGQEEDEGWRVVQLRKQCASTKSSYSSSPIGTEVIHLYDRRQRSGKRWPQVALKNR